MWSGSEALCPPSSASHVVWHPAALSAWWMEPALQITAGLFGYSRPDRGTLHKAPLVFSYMSADKSGIAAAAATLGKAARLEQQHGSVIKDNKRQVKKRSSRRFFKYVVSTGHRINHSMDGGDGVSVSTSYTFTLNCKCYKSFTHEVICDLLHFYHQIWVYVVILLPLLLPTLLKIDLPDAGCVDERHRRQERRTTSATVCVVLCLTWIFGMCCTFKCFLSDFEAAAAAL